jgi:hypothetical protein
VTRDAGVTWANITGNLLSAGAQVLRSAVYCRVLGSGSVAIGSNSGVFAAEGPAFNSWGRLGAGLALAPVLSLQYADADRLVLAGTQGRGAWTLTLPEPAIA